LKASFSYSKPVSQASKGSEPLMESFIPFTDNYLYSCSPLPIRECEYEELLTAFRGVLQYPGEVNTRVILLGPSGSGKSFLANYFKQQLKQQSIINETIHYQLNCVIVDCKIQHSTKDIVIEIIHQLDPSYILDQELCQTAELQYILADLLIERKEALIIIFDHIESLVFQEPEEVNALFYGFQRFSEGIEENPNLFSQILIANDLSFLAELDERVFRRVATDVIPFSKYETSEVCRILEDLYSNSAFLEINKETLWFLASLSEGNLDQAKKLFESSQEIAVKEKCQKVQPEHVRKGIQELKKSKKSTLEVKNLRLGEQLLLLSIARVFKDNEIIYIDYFRLPQLFYTICEEFQLVSLMRFFNNHLNRLKEAGYIAFHTNNNIVFLSLIGYNASELEDNLLKLLLPLKRKSQFYL
jgi:Cdc6-like AAA superfamily ATPase